MHPSAVSVSVASVVETYNQQHKQSLLVEEVQEVESVIKTQLLEELIRDTSTGFW